MTVMKMREKAREVAELMKLLSNDNRLLILCALLKGSMTVGQLSSEVEDITLSALSQHLQKLKASDLIDSQKHGQYVIYFLKDQRLRNLIALLQQEYCNKEAQER